METFLFYFFSAVALIGATFVITVSRPIRALLALIAAMFALAVIYILLGAAFVAMVHLIVYAGAVLVLFLFVIMLQGIGARDIPARARFAGGFLALSTFVGTSFFAGLIFILGTVPLPPAKGVEGPVETIGSLLFQNYLLPFELTSILLLLGVFAAIALAKKDEP